MNYIVRCVACRTVLVESREHLEDEDVARLRRHAVEFHRLDLRRLSTAEVVKLLSVEFTGEGSERRAYPRAGVPPSRPRSVRRPSS